MQKIIGFAISFVFLMAVINRVEAAPVENQYIFNIETKQKEKSKNRWSLSEWLETRDRMRLMDLWLALHSPSPYEFYLSGIYKTGSRSEGGYYGGWDGVVAAYAYLFGLEVQRQTSNVESRWVGLFDFRIFGFHNQATNLTLQAGARNVSRLGNSFWSPLVGASLTLYLAKGFGVEGLYHHAFTPSGSGTVGGAQDRIEAGAFIDFNFVRIFGDYFSDSEAGFLGFSYTGGQLGARIYF